MLDTDSMEMLSSGDSWMDHKDWADLSDEQIRLCIPKSQYDRIAAGAMGMSAGLKDLMVAIGILDDRGSEGEA